MTDLPQRELDAVIEAMRSRPEYFDTSAVISRYESCNLQVLADPFSEAVIAPVRSALKEQRALSVIRIGDGEANLITYGAYAGTPLLDLHAVETYMSMQHDTFAIDSQWAMILRDWILGAVAQADIVGVIGLWRTAPLTVDTAIEMFLRDYRGLSGHWRAIDYMVKLADNNRLDGKIISSAHLYFSVIKHLSDLIPHAKKVIIISNRQSIATKLRDKYKGSDIEHIAVGGMRLAPHALPDKPVFLDAVFTALPTDLRGCLCLVGAGCWAEVYCTWIKKRGGVGVDVGSGLDLLDGEITRPVHKILGEEAALQYRL